MQKKMLYLMKILLLLTMFSCKAQDNIINMKSKDFHIFYFLDKNVHLLNADDVSEIYNSDGLICLTQEWAPYGSRYIKKKYSFVQDVDTMNITCYCGQERNYFFNKIRFEKGDYELNLDYDYSKREIIGSDIRRENTPHLFLKNVYTPKEKNTQQDISLEKVKFIKIDLNDTQNTQLIKLP